MTRSLAYIGVLVLVAGVLLTTCVGSAWSMELLTDEQLAVVRGTDCPDTDCAYGGACPITSGCPDVDLCDVNTTVANIAWDQVIGGIGETTTVIRKLCKDCDCVPYLWYCRADLNNCGAAYYNHSHCVETSK